MGIKNKLGLVLTVLIALLASLCLVLAPYFLGLAIDGMIGIGKVQFNTVKHYLILTAAVYLLNFLLTWLVALVSQYIATNTVSKMRTELKKRLTHLPFMHLDKMQVGDVQTLVGNDGELLIEGINQFINQALSGLFVIVISLIFMLRINVFMTLVTVALVPLMYYTAQYITRRSLKLFRKQQALNAKLASYTAELIQNNELVVSSHYQQTALNAFDSVSQELRDVSEKALFMAALPNPTTRVVNNIGYMLLGVTGAYAVFNLGLTIGLLTSFISYSIMFSKPFNELSAIVSQISAAKAAYDRYQKILKLKYDVETSENRHLEGKTLDMRNVNFSYEKDKPILKDLNLLIKENSKVAIVGPTGAGKSTMINLLMRYYDIDSGTILIDGNDFRDMSKNDTRSVMSIVLQDPWLFEGTIYDNIRYSNPNADEQSVIEAAKKAGVHDYIMSLDNGYQSYVELGSKNISLGQRQMITIARALLKDSPIIILDEATSSLDVVTEQAIQDVFLKIMENKMSFFIAHRLNTVVDSDIILVMKEGRLVESGRHDVLMARNGFYAEMFNAQANH